MTDELTKTFFDTFGIEPRLVESCTKPRHKCSERFVKDCSECPRAWRKYPQITDRILLELICILASNPIRILFESMLSGIKEVELLKNSILLTCITNKDIIKHQVQALFEEG